MLILLHHNQRRNSQPDYRLEAFDAGPSPGFEQLELRKYGFRAHLSPFGVATEDLVRGVATSEGMASINGKDTVGFTKLSGLLGQPPFIKELLRACFWCPPHPPEVEVTAENIPYMQVYKQHQPDVWIEELLEMTMFDLLDEHCETEPFKVLQAMVAWYSGAAGHWAGFSQSPTLRFPGMYGAQLPGHFDGS